MEISVMGSSSKSYKPDLAVLQLSFEFKDKVYKSALDNGLNKVSSFVNNVLLSEGFTKEDLKTSDFYVSEEQVYDENERKYIFSNFIFKQNASLSFPYQIDNLSNIVNKIGMLSDPPLYNVNFELSNKEIAMDEVLVMAFNDSKRKANVIASENNKILKDCIKVDINNENYYEPRILFNKEIGINEKLRETFTPQDIEISKSLSCTWVAF